MKLAFFILLCLVTLVSCAPGPAAFQFYVVIKPGEAGRLFATITSLAKENGLVIAGKQVTSDTGNVTQIVEGRGNGVRFWLQNATSSAREDPNICGIHHEPYADPAQLAFQRRKRRAQCDCTERDYSRFHEPSFGKKLEMTTETNRPNGSKTTKRTDAVIAIPASVEVVFTPSPPLTAASPTTGQTAVRGAGSPRAPDRPSRITSRS